MLLRLKIEVSSSIERSDVYLLYRIGGPTEINIFNFTLELKLQYQLVFQGAPSEAPPWPKYLMNSMSALHSTQADLSKHMPTLPLLATEYFKVVVTHPRTVNSISWKPDAKPDGNDHYSRLR